MGTQVASEGPGSNSAEGKKVRCGIGNTVSSAIYFSSSSYLHLPAQALSSLWGMSFAELIYNWPAFCLRPATDSHSIFGFEVTALCKIGQVTEQGGHFLSSQALSSREAFPEGLGHLERAGQAKDGPGNPRED